MIDFLVDITEKLNQPNKDDVIIDVCNAIKVFSKKILLFSNFSKKKIQKFQRNMLMR